MIYADYEFYATVYRGTALDEEQFCGLARKASAYVDYITMSRARSAAGDKLEAVQNASARWPSWSRTPGSWTASSTRPTGRYRVRR